MQPMSDAPIDREILVLGPNGYVRAYFLCCQWQRDYGDDIPDCWRPVDSLQGDIELDEAQGWKPCE